MLMLSMSGASCASTTSTLWRASPGARATTRLPRSRRRGGPLYRPPAKAIVLCVDEKPSIQALERAQGYLKLPNGRALTGQSHDQAARDHNLVRRARSRHREDHRDAFKAAAADRVSRLHEQPGSPSRIASSTSSSTISIHIRRTSAGSRSIRACISISLRPAHHGSIRSRFGFPFSRASRSTVLPSPPSSSSSSTSMRSSPAFADDSRAYA